MSAYDELQRRYQSAMLGTRHTEMLAREAEDAADTTISYTRSPAGKRALRGVPAIGGTGGLGRRQDPLRYLIEIEKDRRLIDPE